MSSPSAPSPFTINVPGAVLRDLAGRLGRTRFPERTAAPWQAGTDPDYLRELVTYWQDAFDWRARERELNALPQFTADIDGQRVHFVHVRAPGSGPARPALPLVLTHGWPSSFLVCRRAELPRRPASRARQRQRLRRDPEHPARHPRRCAVRLPSGLAAWLVEKYRAWGDCGGDLESRFNKDTLLTMITLYWITGTIGSSFRSYYDDDQAPPLPRVHVPAGITLTPEDRDYPREYAERSYPDIRQWTGPTRGGHFLALEEPALLAADLRAFFRPLRGN